LAKIEEANSKATAKHNEYLKEAGLTSIATRQISRYWQSRNKKKRTGIPGGAIDGKTNP